MEILCKFENVEALLIEEYNFLALKSFTHSLQMDTSPTTGSVTTTVAEKQKLAKASLAFNCKKYVILHFLCFFKSFGID